MSAVTLSAVRALSLSLSLSTISHLDAGLVLAVLCSGALSAAGGPVLVSEIACSHMMCLCMLLMYACERGRDDLPTYLPPIPTYLLYLPLPIYLPTYLYLPT
jgi:hypothetical protein